jgi:hypothetical protein
MKLRIHPHARQRMWERGATVEDIRLTIASGRAILAKFGRTQFRRVFSFNSVWNGKKYARRQIDAFAVKITEGWLVITVIVKYF